MNRIRHLGSAGLLTIAVVLTASNASAETKTPKVDETLPEVVITADRPAASGTKAETLATPLAAFTLTGAPIATALPTTNDTAALLESVPGVATAVGGGVSSLPVIHGFADDRINVLTMGMAITSACANHMNPPLSYVDPSRIGSVEVLSGVVPVSKGGDSIGGTIIVEPRAPRFATGDGIETHGGVAAYYRSNGNGLGGSAFASVADRDWSLEYDGAGVKAQDYKAGGGARIRSTYYASQNHALTLARRLDNGVFTVGAGIQDIPYQAFPNVYMDMGYNRASFVNARYDGRFDWGQLEARAYWQHTEHYMNFLADKMKGVDATPTTGMPMYTKGEDLGWSVKGTLDLGRADTLRIGNELQHTTLDDWWPPVGTKVGMMCCGTFANINGGRRDRLGTFAEWEHVWSKDWTTLLGIRNDTVWMDTGNVVGYSAMTYGADAATFNAAGHAKTDVNFDLTALARWKPTDTIDTEFGYARKSRSPNFYERYAWSSTTMAAHMISWTGDINGYVGNLGLKPEVAHTLSATFETHDAARERWDVKVTPFYSYVENFIDVDYYNAAQVSAAVPTLRFANHDAALWGFEASARTALWASDTWGRFGLGASLDYTHGENLDTHDGLYRVMPLNGKLTLDHRLGDWGNRFDVQLVSEKTDVSAIRREAKTAGYALLNWGTDYQWRNVRLDLGVSNILDTRYDLPLGGVDYADFRATGGTGRPGALPGQGRSIYAGASVKF